MKDYNELIKLILSTDTKDIITIIEDVHPEDLLDCIRQTEDKWSIIRKLPDDKLVDILDQAEDEEKHELMELLPDELKKKILNEMSSDELVDMLATYQPEEVNKMLVDIDKDDAEDVRELLNYKSDSAGGIMATEFISIKENMSVITTIEYLQKEAPEAENAYYIYVLDNRDHLKGVIDLRTLITSPFDTKIRDIMNEKVISVNHHMDQEEVGHIFEKYGFLTVPVVDEDNCMLGIITADDIMEVIRDENTEDIYRLAGMQESVSVKGSVIDSVKKRLPWLFINLVTAIMAATTVSLFEGTIQRAVMLASFMPIVTGMGGNTGTQTLTVIVRSIALGDLENANLKKIMLKEIGVGLITGLSIGLTIGLLGWFWERNIIFGVVIGASMLLNMVTATFAGFVIPVLLKKLGFDPALSSTVFLTTVTDILGFFFFLGLATLLIRFLV